MRYELAMMHGQDMYQQLKGSFESIGRSFPMQDPGAKIGPIDQNFKQNFELNLQHFFVGQNAKND